MSINRNQFLARYGHSEHLHQVIDQDGSVDSYVAHKTIADNSIGNSAVNHQHLTKLLDSKNTGVKKLVAMNDNIEDSHVAKIMADDSFHSGEVKRAAMINANIKPHQLKHAYDTGSKETREIIGKSSYLPEELRQNVLKNTNDPEIHRIVNSRIAQDKKLDDFYDSIKDHPLLNTK